jgi:hypothetical protein
MIITHGYVECSTRDLIGASKYPADKLKYNMALNPPTVFAISSLHHAHDSTFSVATSRASTAVNR